MDYETMNQKMFELSESEKRYLHGDSFDGWKMFQHKSSISILYTGFLTLITIFLRIQNMMKFIL